MSIDSELVAQTTHRVLHVGGVTGVEQLLHNLVIALCRGEVERTSSLL